jgi:hypothetical protein
VSILRELARRSVARLPDPRTSKSLADYAMALAWSGVTKDEGALLLAQAARQLEAQRQAAWDRREAERKAVEAYESRTAGCEAAVMAWWQTLGWAEHGAPDGSGPLFSTTEVSTSAESGWGDDGNY